MKWYIGCSGFYYKSWKGEFYPTELPQKRWFEYYASVFNSLELNVTFYRFPQLGFLEDWYNKSPNGFVFSAKMPRAITHFKQFNETRRMVDDVYNTLQVGLKEKLGCVLFQMPPRMKYSDMLLDRILENVDHAFKNVFEFRHESWWNQHVYNKLAASNIVFCGQSYPGLPEHVIVNSSIAYYRFHGIPQLYHSPYSSQQLKSTFTTIKDASIQEAHIFFNNTDSGHAVKNALKFVDYIKKERLRLKP